MVNWWKTLHWCWASYIFSSSQKWFHHEFFSKKTDVHLGAQYELGFLNCLLQFCFPFNSGYLFGLLLFSSLNIWPQYGNLIIMTFHDGIVENIPKLPLTCHYYQLFASFPNQLISESEKTFEFVLINKLFYKSWKSYLPKLDSPTTVGYLAMAQKVIELQWMKDLNNIWFIWYETFYTLNSISFRILSHLGVFELTSVPYGSYGTRVQGGGGYFWSTRQRFKKGLCMKVDSRQLFVQSRECGKIFF